MTKGARAKAIAVGATLFILVMIAVDIRPSPPQPAPIQEPKSVPAEARCKGYNGEARNLSGLVRKRLRNPASFEHVQTTYGPIDDGAMVATMTYRATNGFGAIDTYTAVGEVQIAGCKARVLTAE